MRASARHWILALLLALAAVGGLTACSGSGETGSGTPLEPAAPTSEATGFDRPSGSHGLSNN